MQITGKTSWADSARDAMKEQCREEAQKNITLPRHLVDEVVNSICVNDCSQHGQCLNGRITVQLFSITELGNYLIPHDLTLIPRDARSSQLTAGYCHFGSW